LQKASKPEGGSQKSEVRRKTKNGNQQKHSAFSIQPAQRFGAVLSGILPSKAAKSKWQLAKAIETQPD
jgi:hypothetical protein